MAIRVASSLHRSRYGILYFRMAVPADLQHRFASKEIYRSLRTSSIRGAANAAQTLSTVLRRAFTEIRRESPAKRKPTVDRFQPPPEVRRLIPKCEEITIHKS
jgi:hypothetical protein